jgi:hypothetical protein
MLAFGVLALSIALMWFLIRRGWNRRHQEWAVLADGTRVRVPRRGTNTGAFIGGDAGSGGGSCDGGGSGGDGGSCG